MRCRCGRESGDPRAVRARARVRARWDAMVRARARAGWRQMTMARCAMTRARDAGRWMVAMPGCARVCATDDDDEGLVDGARW